MKTMQIQLGDDVHRRAKLAAYESGVTLAKYVRDAIEEKVERGEAEQTSPESGWRSR